MTNYYLICDETGERTPYISGRIPMVVQGAKIICFCKNAQTDLSQSTIRQLLKEYLEGQIEKNLAQILMLKELQAEIEKIFVAEDDKTPTDTLYAYYISHSPESLTPLIQKHVVPIKKITPQKIFLQGTFLGKKTLYKSDLYSWNSFSLYMYTYRENSCLLKDILQEKAVYNCYSNATKRLRVYQILLNDEVYDTAEIRMNPF